jgi:hypothetical protein
METREIQYGDSVVRGRKKRGKALIRREAAEAGREFLPPKKKFLPRFYR